MEEKIVKSSTLQPVVAKVVVVWVEEVDELVLAEDVTWEDVEELLKVEAWLDVVGPSVVTWEDVEELPEEEAWLEETGPSVVTWEEVEELLEVAGTPVVTWEEVEELLEVVGPAVVMWEEVVELPEVEAWLEVTGPAVVTWEEEEETVDAWVEVVGPAAVVTCEEVVEVPALPFWQIDWVFVLYPNWATGWTTPEAFTVELETEIVKLPTPPKMFNCPRDGLYGVVAVWVPIKIDSASKIEWYTL